ncbi:tyrosine-type recombinase/integrase [Fluoribacter gormanii]|uniref:tyrosine-type recombinase/integrase n=1 Tax=Fluoribacter gormanii TaxID=464 RepID=UPI001041AC80|nr:tyrosine-type recombinase/integrase [Fluoribacter gormanii]
MKAHAIYQHQNSDIDELLNKAVWLASDIGLKPDGVHSIYSLSFCKITTHWLKNTAMKFVGLQATTRSFSTCRGYIRSFNHFDSFLQTFNTPISPNHVNRELIVSFIQFLAKLGLSPATRSITLINLRTFHQMILLQNWLAWPPKPIIFNRDLAKDSIIVPKHIHKEVIVQLKNHLHYLPKWIQSFVIILMETGRRVSEVCSLNYDCLEQDSDGDWFLRVNEKKLRRIRLIPISTPCLEAVKAQQVYLVNSIGGSPLLFPATKSSKSATITAPHINRTLNKLAIEKNIVDKNGVIWRFSSHQFRHTIGTQMINSGVPQVMVQHYLGHESPEMTARYAHIHNETMKAAFVEYQERLINTQGKIESSDTQINARWLKKNIMSQTLPNGLCSLPLTQQKCPHANACLTCTHFRTSKKHLPQHRAQLEETCKIIENAKENGLQRMVEMNTEIASNLKLIITTLEQENNV